MNNRVPQLTNAVFDGIVGALEVVSGAGYSESTCVMKRT